LKKFIRAEKFALPCPDLQGRAGPKMKTRPALPQGRAGQGNRAGLPCPVTVSDREEPQQKVIHELANQ